MRNKKLKNNAVQIMSANKSNVKLRKNRKLKKKDNKRQLIERKLPFVKNVKQSLQLQFIKMSQFVKSVFLKILSINAD